MIKRIIHISDLHVRNFQRLEEYSVQLTKLIEKCKEISSSYNKEEIRILISGDLFHQKLTVSSEIFSFLASFIRQMEEIAKVIVFAGNHDLIVNNMSRKDPLTGLFETAVFTNTYFLDYELNYQSGTIIDDNVTWCLYSIFNDFIRPNIEESKLENPTNKMIGLYHGVIVGSKLDNGSIMESGLDGDKFEGCDCVMAGDIHKRQALKRGGVPIVYPGSLIQQSFGETVTQHGFCLWNIEDMSFEFIDLESDYSLYDFVIEDFNDIDNNKERLINF